MAPTGSPREEPPVGSGHGLDGVEEFVREFRILDCYCCDRPIAFQHRASGRVYCTSTTCIREQREGMRTEGDAIRSIIPFTFASSSSSHYVAPPAPIVPVIAAPPPTRALAPTTALLNASLARTGCGLNPLFKESPAIKPELLAALLNKVPKTQEVAKQTQMTGGEDEHDAATAPKGNNDAGKAKVTSPPKLAKTIAVATAASATAPVTPPKAVTVVPKTMVPTQVRTTVTRAAATPPPPPPSPKRFMWEDCSFSANLKDGSIVKASFLYNVNKPHVCAEDDDAALADLQAKILEYITNGGAVKNSTMSPVMNEMVLAEYQEEYYRARIIDVGADGKCTLLFVDFGDTATKRDYKDCYQITPDFMKVPIMGVPLLLVGTPPVDMSTFNIGLKMEELLYSRVILKLLEPLKMGARDTFDAELTTIDTHTSLNKVLATVVTASMAAANTGDDEDEDLDSD